MLHVCLLLIGILATAACGWTEPVLGTVVLGIGTGLARLLPGIRGLPPR